MEYADGDQPHPHDLVGYRAAEPLAIVGINVALLVKPFAEIGEPRAGDHVRLAMRPGRDRTAERGLGRQRAAPEIGDVLPVIELDRDAEIIVGRQRILRQL